MIHLAAASRLVGASWLAVSFTVMAAQSGSELVDRMLRTYAEAQTYSDTGTVLVHLQLESRPDEVKFETVFSRPSLFRFSWTTHHPYPSLRHIETHSVIWSDGTGVYTRLGIPPDKSAARTEESLRIAVAGASGVSSGAAHTVSVLLLPGIGGLSLNQLKSPTVAGMESIEGVECHHIQGELPRVGILDVWIGANDYLIRKVAARIGGVLHEEFRRNVRVNEPLPAQRFQPGPAN